MKKTGTIYSILILICLFLGCYTLFHPRPQREQKYSQLSNEGSYFLPVKIIGFEAYIPCIEVQIEDKIVKAKIDMGFEGMMKLPSESLNELKTKSFVCRRAFYGVRGKKYETNTYSIPEIKIGGMTFFGVKVDEENDEFAKDTVLITDNVSSAETYGNVGWHLFRHVNLFLDCNHSMIAFCDSLDTLKKHRYPVESFTEATMLLDRGLMEFEAQTELGPLRCTVDTGCTWNMLNKNFNGESNEHMIFNPIQSSRHAAINPENSDLMLYHANERETFSSFKVRNKDLGLVEFRKLQSPLQLDAIIGMDFLESRLVFFDFPHRKIYFSDAQLARLTPEQMNRPKTPPVQSGKRNE